MKPHQNYPNITKAAEMLAQENAVLRTTAFFDVLDDVLNEEGAEVLGSIDTYLGTLTPENFHELVCGDAIDFDVPATVNKFLNSIYTDVVEVCI